MTSGAVARPERLAEPADDAADAFERVGGGGLVHPGHEAEMVLVEAVVEGALGGIDVDRRPAEQVAHPHGEHGAAIAQPAISGLRVGGEHVLDDVIDVVRHDLAHLEGGQPFEVVTRRLAQQLLDAVVEEPGLADPVGADEEGGGDVLLGEPAGVVDGGGRCGDRGRLVDVDERADGGVDVLADAGEEQTGRLVRPEPGDGLFDHGLDVGRHRGQSLTHRVRDRLDQRTNTRVASLHGANGMGRSSPVVRVSRRARAARACRSCPRRSWAGRRG